MRCQRSREKRNKIAAERGTNLMLDDIRCKISQTIRLAEFDENVLPASDLLISRTAKT